MIAQHVQLAADVRSSDGGPAGPADSRSASLGLVHLTPLGLGLRARATKYSGQSVSGMLQSASIEASPVTALRVEVSGGTRRDAVLGPTAQEPLRWFGADADVALSRSLYFMLSTQYESRGAERARQSYTALSWRF